MRDKHQIIEEPCEGKLSCTVLKTSETGDSLAEFNRSCHDAIGAIYNSIRQKTKYVLDADIAKCFDRIDHKALLDKVKTYPTRSTATESMAQGRSDDKRQFLQY